MLERVNETMDDEKKGKLKLAPQTFQSTLKLLEFRIANVYEDKLLGFN